MKIDMSLIWMFQSLGYMSIIRETKEGYELTEKGTHKYHLVEQAYTHQYIDKTWRIAR